MKKILTAIIIVAGLSAAALAQHKIRPIVFVNTLDESIGTQVAYTYNEILLPLLADVLASNQQYSLDDEFVPYYEGECCNAKLMEALDNFRCDTSDIIIFCYFGHGVRATTDTSVFPQMCLGEKDESKFVPLEYVKERLAKHGARLTVVVGDCCNSYGEWVRSKELPLPAAGATALSGPTTNVLHKLFFETTGVVTMCASRPGEYGWVDAKGNIFFRELVSAMHSLPLNNVIAGDSPWQSLLNNVQSTVGSKPIVDRTKKTYYMHPRYKIEKRRGKTSDGRRPNVNRKPNPDIELENLLATLYNESESMYSRAGKVAPLQNRYFADKAVVKQVGRDNRTYFDAKLSSEYLEELSMAKRLGRVAVRHVERNADGKITLLIVHHIYINQN